MITVKRLKYVLREAKLVALGLLVMPIYTMAKFTEGRDYRFEMFNPPTKGDK